MVAIEKSLSIYGPFCLVYLFIQRPHFLPLHLVQTICRYIVNIRHPMPLGEPYPFLGNERPSRAICIVIRRIGFFYIYFIHHSRRFSYEIPYDNDFCCEKKNIPSSVVHRCWLSSPFINMPLCGRRLGQWPSIRKTDNSVLIFWLETMEKCLKRDLSGIRHR